MEGVIVVDAPLGGSGVAAGCFGLQAEGVIVVAAVVVAAFDATPAVVGVVVAVPTAGATAGAEVANFTSNITKINVIANIKRGIMRSPHATISALCIASHTNADTEMSPNTKCSGIFAVFPEKISDISIPMKRAAVIIAE